VLWRYHEQLAVTYQSARLFQLTNSADHRADTDCVGSPEAGRNYRDSPNLPVDDFRFHGISRERDADFPRRHSFSSWERCVANNVASLPERFDRCADTQLSDALFANYLVSARRQL
jgi:hypothetical protein